MILVISTTIRDGATLQDQVEALRAAGQASWNQLIIRRQEKRPGLEVDEQLNVTERARDADPGNVVEEVTFYRSE